MHVIYLPVNYFLRETKREAEQKKIYVTKQVSRQIINIHKNKKEKNIYMLIWRFMAYGELSFTTFKIKGLYIGYVDIIYIKIMMGMVKMQREQQHVWTVKKKDDDHISSQWLVQIQDTVACSQAGMDTARTNKPLFLYRL